MSKAKTVKTNKVIDFETAKKDKIETVKIKAKREKKIKKYGRLSQVTLLGVIFAVISWVLSLMICIGQYTIYNMLSGHTYDDSIDSFKETSSWIDANVYPVCNALLMLGITCLLISILFELIYLIKYKKLITSFDNAKKLRLFSFGCICFDILFMIGLIYKEIVANTVLDIMNNIVQNYPFLIFIPIIGLVCIPISIISIAFLHIKTFKYNIMFREYVIKEKKNDK